MRPPLLSDEAIRAAIRDVLASGERLTGVAVRARCAERHGARGGVARVYRLIREAARGPAARGVRPVPWSDSRETREEAIARADLAEERERVHQQRWARETDALRSRLARAEESAREGFAVRQRVADLSLALASAQARIAALEQQLAERSP
ncbi:MAG: hypothetical protein JSR54_00480 [Proteobacteria bacterium]|nr:hypothetical protein [Pseudomonadota bacterium]